MIYIREATLEDLPQLAQLFDLYRKFYGSTSDPDACVQFLQQRMKKSESLIYVAQDGNELVGFCQNYWQFSSVSMNQMVVLNDLFVVKKYRNQGVGKKLIDAVKKYCMENNFKGVQLETGFNNKPGNHLYPSEGFTLQPYNTYFWKNPNQG